MLPALARQVSAAHLPGGGPHLRNDPRHHHIARADESRSAAL